MNVYRMLGNNVGTPEAQALAERLSSWHDAMVSHERTRRTDCDDECPHADAAPLWQAAVEAFGSRAEELRFLQSRSATRAIGREDYRDRPAASWSRPQPEDDGDRPAASWSRPQPGAAREDRQ